MRWRGAPWAAVWLLGLAGCGPTRIEFDVSEAGDAAIAVVLLDDSGAPVRALPVFGLAEGRLEFGVRPVLRLEAEEAEAVWVRIPRAVMQDRFPGAWAARETFTVALERPPEVPAARPSADGLRWRWRSALPDGVQIEGDGTGRVRTELTFLFEQEAEPCRDPTRGPLRAYADRPRALDGVDAGLLRSMLVVDASLVIVGGKGLFVLERGQPFGGLTVTPQALLHPNAEVFALELDPRTARQPRKRIYAAAYSAEGGPARSAIVEVQLDAEGLRVVRTATVVPGVLRAMDVSARGEIAASSDEGLVVISEPDGQGFFRQDFEHAPDVPPYSRALTFTEDPRESLLVTSTSRLHARPADGGGWRDYLFNQSRASIEVEGIVAEGARAWLGGSDNALIRRNGSEFVQVELTYPPRIGSCSESSELRPPITSNLDVADVALLEGDPVLGVRGCTTLFRVRSHDACVSTIHLEGGPQVSEGDISRIRVFGDQIVTADWAGRVLLSVPE